MASSESNSRCAIICFTIYTICYEMIIWSAFGFAVFVADRSGFWIIAATILSTIQLRPYHFGIQVAQKSALAKNAPPGKNLILN